MADRVLNIFLCLLRFSGKADPTGKEGIRFKKSYPPAVDNSFTEGIQREEK